MDWFNWFWEFFGIELENFSPAEQSLLEILPIVIGLVVVIGAVGGFMGFRKKGEEEEVEKLTGLDLEVSEIKRLQGKRFKRWGLF